MGLSNRVEELRSVSCLMYTPTVETVNAVLLRQRMTRWRNTCRAKAHDLSSLGPHCTCGVEPQRASTKFLDYSRLQFPAMTEVPKVSLLDDPLAACFFV